jgi:hypothetical protein
MHLSSCLSLVDATDDVVSSDHMSCLHSLTTEIDSIHFLRTKLILVPGTVHAYSKIECIDMSC